MRIIKNKFNLFLLVVLVICFINVGTYGKSILGDEEESAPASLKTKPTIDTDSISLVDDVPTKHKKGGSSEVAAGTSSTGGSEVAAAGVADSGSSSKPDLGEINGRAIIECTGTQSLELQGSELESMYRETSGTLDPYTCALTRGIEIAEPIKGGETVGAKKTRAVVPSKSVAGLAKLTINQCKSAKDCFEHKVTCSEIEITNGGEGFNYGTFSIQVKPGHAVNTVTKISVISKLGSNGSQFGDAYIIVKGNATEGKYGFHYNGLESGNTNNRFTIPMGVSMSVNNYTIFYTRDQLSFYIGGSLIGGVPVAWTKEKAPAPPVYFRISYQPNVEAGASTIRKSDFPATAYVGDFNYVAGPCVEDTEETINWGSPKAYLDYFTGNCTIFRPLSVFNDSLADDWSIKAKGNSQIQDTLFKRIGSNIAFGFNNGRTSLRFVTTKPFPIHRHKYLIFWINGGTKGRQNLWISVTYKNHIVGKLNVNDFIVGGIDKNQWYKVIIITKKFQIQESKKVTLIDGFMFQPSYDAFMDLTYFDDIVFSNGTACMKTTDSYKIYDKGNFTDTVSTENTVGNINKKSEFVKYKKQNTIEYQIQKSSLLQINFMNGSLATTEYDALTFNVYFIPDVNYLTGGQNDVGGNGENIVNALRLQICLLETDGVGSYPCLSLSAYVGGRFPTNRWFTLNIPWNDLSVDFEGASFGGFKIKSPDDMDEQIHQGTLYISQISAGHYKPPPVAKLIDSPSTKLTWNFNLLSILLIISISLILL